MDGWDGEQGGEASSMVIYSFFHSLMEDLNCIRRSAWVRLPIIPSCGSHLGAVSSLVLRLLPKLFSCKHFGCMQLCCISMENCNAAGLWDCTADCCSSNEVASFSLPFQFARCCWLSLGLCPQRVWVLLGPWTAPQRTGRLWPEGMLCTRSYTPFFCISCDWSPGNEAIFWPVYMHLVSFPDQSVCPSFSSQTSVYVFGSLFASP